MPNPSTAAATFFKRARREAARYGDDAFVFLRELVQNGRDAGATLIEFETRTEGQMQVLRCHDNGHGMDEASFEGFLLRLYASNKEGNRGSIGFYGVGFWSVLLFKPRWIRIFSRCRGRELAYEIDCAGFTICKLAPGAGLQGTTIELIRPRESDSDEHLADLVRSRLAHYAGHLRPLAGSQSLDLFCDGEHLNRPFPLPELYGKRFKTKRFDGVIGFGPRPLTRIYKGGILVRDLASLDEVLPSRRSRLPRAGFGLFPCIQLNIDGLDVLMDRQSIYEDPLLHEAVAHCELLLLRFHRKMIKKVFPIDIKNRIFLLAATSAWRRLTVRAVLLAVILIAAWILVTQWPLAPPAAAPLFSSSLSANSALPTSLPPRVPVDRWLDGWHGSQIDRPARGHFQWDFSYQGADHIFFRMATFTRYEPRSGLQPDLIEGNRPYAASPEGDSSNPVTIRFGVSRSGNALRLPMPPGHALRPASLKFDDRFGLPVYLDQHGAAFIRPTHPGVLVYQTYQSAGATAVVFNQPQAEGVALVWPAAYLDLLKSLRSLPVEARVAGLTARIREDFTYSQDPDLARRFNEHSGDWLTKAFQAKAGDCDVLNGVMTLLLQESRIPAQLCVGLVGEGGRALADLHAWVRYFDDGWQVLDVSTGVADDRPRSHVPGLGEGRSLGGAGAGIDQPQSPVAASEGSVLNEPPLESPIPAPHTLDTIRNRALGLAILAAALSAAAIIWRRRRAPPPAVDGQHLSELFQQYLSFGAVGDPLNLRFRPVFPLVGSGRASLFEIQKFAAAATLIGAFPGCRLLPLVRERGMVLDRSQEVVSQLESFLPATVWLEDLDRLFQHRPLPPFWQSVESRIRHRDPLFRLHLVEGSNRFVEVDLALKSKRQGKHHFLLGEKHAIFQKVQREYLPDRRHGVFHAVRVLLERSTLYLDRREGMLQSLAAEELP